MFPPAGLAGAVGMVLVAKKSAIFPNVSVCGTDLGGNATPIGASANVVGTSASAKGGYPIGWGRYCKYCVPATIIVMAVSTAYLFLRYL